jgi:hypothetical protein
MGASSLQDGTWSSVLVRLSEVADLAATARRFGAFARARKVKTPQDLLRLAFLYGPARLSLRLTAAMADEAGIASLSDKAVLGRLRKAGPWLEHLLLCLMADKQMIPAGACGEGLNLALVDGSVICCPGSKGGDWRLHGRFDPGRGGFTDMKLSTAKVGERVEHTQITPGSTVVQDRGYARVRDFGAVLAQGADFITRIGWRSLRLRAGDGQPIDIFALLPPHHQPVDHGVHLPGIAAPLRLIIQQIPSDKAEQRRRKVARKSSKAGHQIDPRTTTAAGYLMLVTSLPATTHSPERITALYRSRWQVELGFKRLKSIGGIDELPAFDPDLARTWLLAHLIAAALADEIASEIVGFPPSAESHQPPPHLDMAGLSPRPPNPAPRHPAPAQTT